MRQITGYHFTGNKLRDGRTIPQVGEWLRHEGDIAVCQSGLHASEDPFDALQYSPGNTLHKVSLRGDLLTHGEPVDKYVGRERKILASINAEKLVRDFSRWCALQVIHLWDAPPIVKQYLETGDEKLRAAARAAAWAAARASARASAWAAARADAWASARDDARASARAAAWDDAWAAARAAAWAAARADAWDDAWDDARAAARASARDDAWDAAWAAARADAWDAARDEFVTKARKEFKRLVDQAFKEAQ